MGDAVFVVRGSPIGDMGGEASGALQRRHSRVPARLRRPQLGHLVLSMRRSGISLHRHRRRASRFGIPSPLVTVSRPSTAVASRTCRLDRSRKC